MCTVRVRSFSDGYRIMIEIYDQAAGQSVLKNVRADAESGRGLPIIDRITGGRRGWHAVRNEIGKCVWAELCMPKEHVS